jgi:MFS family permease
MASASDGQAGGYGFILQNAIAMKIFLITSAAFMAKSIYTGAVFSAYIFLLMDRSNTAVGGITGMSGLTSLILAPIVGYISDKWDRAEFARFSSLFGVMGLAFAVYAVSQNSFPLMMLSEVIWGLFWAIFSPTTDALLADSAEEGTRSKYFTVTTVIKNLASSAGPLTSLVLFLLLGNTWDISICRTVMYVGLGLFVIPLVMLAFFKAPSKHDATNDGKYGIVSTNENIDDDDKLALEMASTHLKDVFSEIHVNDDGALEEGQKLAEMRERKFAEINVQLESRAEAQNRAHYICGDILLVPAAVAVGDVITGLASGMTIKFMPIFMLDMLNMAPDKVQIVYTASPLLIAGATILVTSMSKTLGRVWATVLSKSIGTSLLLLLAYQAHLYIYYLEEVGLPPEQHPWYCSVPAILMVFLVRTVIMNTTKPLTRSIVMDAVPRGQRGRWQGLESVNAATWSGSAVMGGWLIDKYGFVGVFVATALMQALAMVPLMWVSSLVPPE